MSILGSDTCAVYFVVNPVSELFRGVQIKVHMYIPCRVLHRMCSSGICSCQMNAIITLHIYCFYYVYYIISYLVPLTSLKIRSWTYRLDHPALLTSILSRERWQIGIWFQIVVLSRVDFFVPHFEETEKGAIYDPFKRDLLVPLVLMTSTCSYPVSVLRWGCSSLLTISSSDPQLAVDMLAQWYFSTSWLPQIFELYEIQFCHGQPVAFLPIEGRRDAHLSLHSNTYNAREHSQLLLPIRGRWDDHHHLQQAWLEAWFWTSIR